MQPMKSVGGRSGGGGREYELPQVDKTRHVHVREKLSMPTIVNNATDPLVHFMTFKLNDSKVDEQFRFFLLSG